MSYKNFRVETDADGIALVTWDIPGRSMNVLDETSTNELDAIVKATTADAAVKGVVITKVAPNSPAAEKQLQAGDVILEVDQKPVASPQEVSDLVAKLQQAKKRSVLLFVERQGDPRFAALRLGK